MYFLVKVRHLHHIVAPPMRIQLHRFNRDENYMTIKQPNYLTVHFCKCKRTTILGGGSIKANWPNFDTYRRHTKSDFNIIVICNGGDFKRTAAFAIATRKRSPTLVNF